MKKYSILLLSIAVMTFSSCLKKGLEELPAYEDADITGAYFEYRYTFAGPSGLPELKTMSLSATGAVDAAQQTVDMTVTVPVANSIFTEAEHDKLVALENLCVRFNLSNAASIEPVDGAPMLGAPGNFAVPRKYKVTAADGVTSKIWTITVTTFAEKPDAILRGRWLFDDAGNFGKATTGRDLEMVGSGFTQVDGPTNGSKAVRVALESYFKCIPAGLASGENGSIDEYSLVFDVKYPVLDKWYSFYSHDLTFGGNDDADLFINKAGKVGVGDLEYSAGVLPAGVWNRVIISVKRGEWIKIYFNGALAHDAPKLDRNGNLTKARFFLDPAGFTLFGDNDGDDGEFDISEVQLYEGAMNETRAQSLGRAGSN